MAECRSCKADIFWVETVNAKPMPLDKEPTATGNVIVRHDEGRRGPVGIVVAEADLDSIPPERQRYTSHFATCPDGPSWRKRK